MLQVAVSYQYGEGLHDEILHLKRHCQGAFHRCSVEKIQLETWTEKKWHIFRSSCNNEKFWAPVGGRLFRCRCVHTGMHNAFLSDIEFSYLHSSACSLSGTFNGHCWHWSGISFNIGGRGQFVIGRGDGTLRNHCLGLTCSARTDTCFQVLMRFKFIYYTGRDRDTEVNWSLRAHWRTWWGQAPPQTC